MTTISNLHNLPSGTEAIGFWHDPGGTLADTNPHLTKIPHGISIWSPSLYNSRLDFQPAAAWDNLYWYTKLQLPTTAPQKISYDITFQLTDSDLQGNTAFESEDQLTWKGFIYNHAWQLELVTKQWRYFDYKEARWIQVTSIPAPLVNTCPVVMIANSVLDENAHTVTHKSLVVNGVEYPINITLPAVPTKDQDKFTLAIQLDSRNAPKGKKPPKCGVNLYNISLQYE